MIFDTVKREIWCEFFTTVGFHSVQNINIKMIKQRLKLKWFSDGAAF